MTDFDRSGDPWVAQELTLTRREFIKQAGSLSAVTLAPNIETLEDNEANCLYGQDAYGAAPYNGICEPTAISINTTSTRLPRVIVYAGLVGLGGLFIFLQRFTQRNTPISNP